MNYIALLFLSVSLLSACTEHKKNASQQPVESVPIRYAQGFAVSRFDSHTEIEVRDPWDSTRILQRYLLVEREKEVPAGLPTGTLVRTPIAQVVSYSSVGCGMLNELEMLNELVGVCESRYIDIPFIKDALASERIADLGESTAPNVERMLNIGAEAILATPFQNGDYGPAAKIGIPIIECADYMEPTPLGRAEWIRFYAFFCNREALADSIFRQTEQRYLALKALAATATHRPTVIAERKFGGVWYVPGGNSYMAHFYQDAGAEYPFADMPESGSVPYAFEKVLDRAAHADFWLIKYNLQYEMSYANLRQEYAPYSNFDAFANRTIYTCNTAVVPYYEELPTHPDYLLREFVWLFHPELLPNYTPRYYQKMKE